jgi:hypothetical protein
MEVVETIARLLHSWTRWLFLVVTVIAVVIFALAWLRAQPWTTRANALLNAYSGLMGLQWLFGLVLLGVWGSMSGFGQRHFWEHLTVQTIAVVVANAHHGWRRRELTDKARYGRGLAVILVSLVLVVIGIFVLPVGIQWRFYTP